MLLRALTARPLKVCSLFSLHGGTIIRMELQGKIIRKVENKRDKINANLLKAASYCSQK